MIKTFPQAISYLRRSIPNHKHRFPGNLGLARQTEILRLLGDPQNKIKSIHIAGTSGKGSTAFYLSSLLVKQGFNVGLTLSPHLLDIRERFQINNQLISQTEVVDYLNQIIPVLDQVKNSKLGQPTFFEILIALSFYIFYQKKVDYIVVETGLGGLMDGTNTITSSDQVVVITKLGLDHTAVLGPNLTAITTQKAGIIHSYNPVFSARQYPVAQKILDQTVKKKNTTINYIRPKINFKNIQPQHHFLTYDFSCPNLTISKIKLNTLGLYQVENSALALSVLSFLSIRDNFILDIFKIKQILATIKFSGRADLHQIGGHSIILDGAHNPQKMKSLILSLKNFYPQKKFTFLLAFKQRKDFSQMIKMIIPIADQIIITGFKVNFQDMVQISQSTSSIVSLLKKIKFSNYQIIPDQSLALKTAIKSSRNIVVTGSLYLLGEIYPLLKKIKL